MTYYSKSLRVALFLFISLTLTQAWTTDTSPSSESGPGSEVFTDIGQSRYYNVDHLNLDTSNESESHIIAQIEEHFGLLDAGLNSDKLVFGPEFTFWVPLIQNGVETLRGHDYPSKSTRKLAKKMIEHLAVNQPEGSKFVVRRAVRDDFATADFYSPNGWSAHVKTDGGVIEVTMSPMTVEDYKKFKDDIQDAIFVSAANVGYKPSAYGGGGHLNLNLAYLKKRPLLLRNFVVDLLNHNELFLGVFNYDTNNSLSPSLFRNDNWHTIIRALEKLDTSEINLENVISFLLSYSRTTYGSYDPYMQFWDGNEPEHDIYSGQRNKFTAIKFERKMYLDEVERRYIFTDIRDPMELRAVRPQASMDVWVRQIQLIESRIKYLEKLDKPIPLKPLLKVTRFDRIPQDELKSRALESPADPQEALKAFHQYVTEAGESWDDHQDYLWPKWIEDGEVEKFNASLCSQLFEE